MMGLQVTQDQGNLMEQSLCLYEMGLQVTQDQDNSYGIEFMKQSCSLSPDKSNSGWHFYGLGHAQDQDNSYVLVI